MYSKEDFNVLDFDLFPVFEYIAGLRLRNKKLKRSSVQWRFVDIFQSIFQFLFFFIFIRAKQSIYITSENNKVEIQNMMHDRVVDPFIANNSDDASLKLNFSLHRRRGKEKYKSSANISFPIFILGAILYPFLKTYAKDIELCWNMYVNSFHTKDKDDLLQVNIFKIFCNLVSASIICSNIIKRSRAKQLFVSNPYSIETIGALFAAHKADLETIALQHGVQTLEHFAFKFSKKLDLRGSNTLPKTYYLWDHYSKADILSFSTFEVKGFWFHDYVRKMNINIENFFDQDFRSYILVTTQPSTGLLAKEVQQLAQSNLNSGIFLRLHPSQVNNKSLEILDNYLGKISNVEYRKASSIALPLLIPLCNIHLTGFSSCIIEAANLGIKSYTFSNKALEYYPEYIESKKLEYLSVKYFWKNRWFL